MPLYVNPKKSPAWAKKARQGTQEPPRATEREGAVSSDVAPRRTAHSASPRPGTLAWATEQGWQLGTHQEEGVLYVYAWKGERRTAYYPAGSDRTEATFYRPALDAAVEMSR